MIYLKEFETEQQYGAAKDSGLILPSVSLVTESGNVYYNTYMLETRVVAKFNVTDTNNPTPIGNGQYTSGFSAIEIDGVEQPSVVSAYTFSTTGEHTIKYTLTDPTTIGASAFEDCSGLSSITIPNSVTSIGASAFDDCGKLTTITIPNSVTSIGERTFAWCSGLTSVTIGSGVTSIGTEAFICCTSLTSITIPSGVTSIGKSTFEECSGLSSITIPNSVTSIGNYAFFDCLRLTSVTIPSGVTSIGKSAFKNNLGLSSVTCLSTTPPTLPDKSAFDYTNYCPIYVPSGSVEAYKSASGWSGCASRIQAIQ